MKCLIVVISHLSWKNSRTSGDTDIRQQKKIHKQKKKDVNISAISRRSTWDEEKWGDGSCLIVEKELWKLHYKNRITLLFTTFFLSESYLRFGPEMLIKRMDFHTFLFCSCWFICYFSEKTNWLVIIHLRGSLNKFPDFFSYGHFYW